LLLAENAKNERLKKVFYFNVLSGAIFSEIPEFIAYKKVDQEKTSPTPRGSDFFLG